MRHIYKAMHVAIISFAMTCSITHAVEVQLIELGRQQKGILLVGANIHRLEIVGAKVIRISFSNKGTERRFFGIETTVKVANAQLKALVATYRFTLTNGKPPRPCVVAFDAMGNSWFNSSRPLSPTNEFRETRISLAGFVPTAFSQRADVNFSISSVKRLWVGFVADGESSGIIELYKLSLSDEPYKPTEPLPVSLTGDWRLIKDPAVKGQLSLIHEGTPPKPCMKFEFVFPTGRHMYALPVIPFSDAELFEYSALQFTYMAKLPEGIGGLLICLWERDGSQYYAEPAPPPSSEWRTVTIPFSSFKLGGWSKDENERLDLGQVECVVVGVHGTATGKDGSGFIIACDLKFVP
ncbi:MAG: hypothetical protein N2381_07570 [Armatimonadetes bacterium]|nr:hypothetical protein [Armatimonadota bacterium]MCX7777897.1 hypothetical protein [Armatimonadota bacterium]